MKYLHQFLIIIGITFVGELLKYLLPLPIPASIYGMVIMFIGLMTGFIKLDAVKDVGKFLIEIMPIMFIPAGVGLMSSWSVLKPLLLPVSIITVVTIIPSWVWRAEARSGLSEMTENVLRRKPVQRHRRKMYRKHEAENK